MARKDKGYRETFENLAGGEEEIKESVVKDEEEVVETEVTEVAPSDTTYDENDELKKELLEGKKKSFDDMYKRKTFPLDNELYKRLEKHFKGKGRGYQTKFAKYAITKALDELESKK